MSRPPLRIGGLPGPQLLRALPGQGWRRLVNLCGVDLAEIYGGQALAGWHSSLFVFPDVFSPGRPCAPGAAAAADARLYLDASSEPQRQQFLGAIEATCEALSLGEPVFVFCQQGVARSPLVALAALLRCGGHSLAGGLGHIRQLQPAAVFTDISLAALRWSQSAGRG